MEVAAIYAQVIRQTPFSLSASQARMSCRLSEATRLRSAAFAVFSSLRRLVR